MVCWCGGGLLWWLDGCVLDCLLHLWWQCMAAVISLVAVCGGSLMVVVVYAVVVICVVVFCLCAELAIVCGSGSGCLRSSCFVWRAPSAANNSRFISGGSAAKTA